MDPKQVRYWSLSPEERVEWIGEQMFALNLMVHTNPQNVSAGGVFLDASMFDTLAKEEEGIKNLTLIEMQEAFRRGISREYGDFFGITSISLIGFLKGFMRGEKRQKALTLISQDEEKKLREKDKLFYQELERAHREMGIEIPSWRTSRKKTYTSQDSSEHRAKIEKQREEILKQYGHD